MGRNFWYFFLFSFSSFFPTRRRFSRGNGAAVRKLNISSSLIGSFAGNFEAGTILILRYAKNSVNSDLRITCESRIRTCFHQLIALCESSYARLFCLVFVSFETSCFTKSSSEGRKKKERIIKDRRISSKLEKWVGGPRQWWWDVNVNQKREYRILEKKVALCRFAEGRERERRRKRGRNIRRAGVTSWGKTQEWDKERELGAVCYATCTLHTCTTISTVSFLPFIRSLFSSDRLKGNNVGRKKHA